MRLNPIFYSFFKPRIQNVQLHQVAAPPHGLLIVHQSQPQALVQPPDNSEQFSPPQAYAFTTYNAGDQYLQSQQVRFFHI